MNVYGYEEDEYGQLIL